MCFMAIWLRWLISGVAGSRVALCARHGTELLKGSQHVELGALLDDLAARQSIERHALRDDGLARRWVRAMAR
jgi:hypothetical protein